MLNQSQRGKFIVDQLRQICSESEERLLEDIISLFDGEEDELADEIVEQLEQDDINLITYVLLTNFPGAKRTAYSCFIGANVNKLGAIWLLKKVLMEKRKSK